MRQVKAFAKTLDEALTIVEATLRRDNENKATIVAATVTLARVEFDLTSYRGGPRIYVFDVLERVTMP